MKYSLWLMFGGLVMLGLSAIAGVRMVYGFLMLIAAAGFFLTATVKKSKSNSLDQTWINDFSHCKYRFSGNKTGIALDESTRKVHLLQDEHSKSYDFADVRSWNTNLQTGGMTVSTGGTARASVNVALANWEQSKKNSENTGLFLKMRDIEKPEWRIRFSQIEAEEKAQQTRWMEILTQVFNENAVSQAAVTGTQTPIAAPGASQGRFCASCGAKNSNEATFCEACGARLNRVS